MSNYQVNHESNTVNPSAAHHQQSWLDGRTPFLTQNELSWDQLSEACRSLEYDNGSNDLVDYVFETKTMD